MFKSLLVVATVVAIAVSSSLVAAANFSPPKPEWPPQFSQPFGLSADLLPKYDNVSSRMYYKWEGGLNATRISYPKYCFPLIPSGMYQPCDIFFLPVGTFHTYHDDGKPKCCKLFDIGGVPPNFLRGFQFDKNATGKDMFGREHECYEWDSAPGASPGFLYYTDKATGADVRLRDGPTGIWWAWSGSPFAYEPQQSSLFELPKNAGNCEEKCKILGTDTRGVEALYRFGKQFGHY